MSVTVGSEVLLAGKNVRHMGVVMDSVMNMEAHTYTSVCRACYFHLCNIGAIIFKCAIFSYGWYHINPDNSDKLPQLQCYHTIPKTRHIYLTKNVC
jgi:hypothetical protein